MTEAVLKGILVKLLRTEIPSAVVFRHEDRLSHGHPDISFTCNRKTTWIEVKFANPDFVSKGIQELTMLRLDLVGSAIYVVYSQTKEGLKYTYIVYPREIGEPTGQWRIPPFGGFAHKSVCNYLQELHNVNNYRS